MKRALLVAVLVLLPTLAHAQFTVDGRSALHFGVSAGVGYTLNSAMIAAQGQRDRNSAARPWVVLGACMAVGAVKEEILDSERDMGDYTFNLLGCGLSIWASERLWVSVEQDKVLLHGSF